MKTIMEQIKIKQAPTQSEDLKRNLIYSSLQLNEHLSKELADLQELKNSRITNRIVRLAEATAKITELALVQFSDVDAVIENTVS
ncbi:MAG: hypothetical protein LKJ03_07330 [Enterococcaceae bacterium]|nr:hypothetical protein [Enterococcaceae bacterium]